MGNSIGMSLQAQKRAIRTFTEQVIRKMGRAFLQAGDEAGLAVS